MAKLGCVCGHTIRDQSDYLPYKADYISDTISFDVVDLAARKILGKIKEAGLEDTLADEIGNILWSEIFVEYGRQLFECEKCGRLIVQCSDGANRYMRYKPERDEYDDPNERCIYSETRISLDE